MTPKPKAEETLKTCDFQACVHIRLSHCSRTTAMYESCRYRKAVKDGLFIEHIAGHLGPGQEVVCKICEKTVDEICGNRRTPAKDDGGLKEQVAEMLEGEGYEVKDIAGCQHIACSHLKDDLCDTEDDNCSNRTSISRKPTAPVNEGESVEEHELKHGYDPVYRHHKEALKLHAKIATLQAALAERDKRIEELGDSLRTCQVKSAERGLEIKALKINFQAKLKSAEAIIKRYAQCDLDCDTQHPVHSLTCSCGCEAALSAHDKDPT